MYEAIIISRLYGSISICEADFYSRSIVVGEEVEKGGHNIFGEKLPDIVRPKRKTIRKLIEGDGIRSFDSELELKDFLSKIGFTGKIYTEDQIHKEVL